MVGSMAAFMSTIANMSCAKTMLPGFTTLIDDSRGQAETDEHWGPAGHSANP